MLAGYWLAHECNCYGSLYKQIKKQIASNECKERGWPCQVSDMTWRWSIMQPGSKPTSLLDQNRKDEQRNEDENWVIETFSGEPASQGVDHNTLE